MSASPKSIDNSKSINLFPDELCKTAQDDDELICGSYNGQPSGGFNKLQVDENVTETGERDSMKALVERTGRAAKRARMANI